MMLQTVRDTSLSTLTIDLAAISHNIRTIRRHLSPHTRLLPMVKAHGYGTDALPLAQFLTEHGVDIIGVAHLSEAIFLRESGFVHPIFLIHAAPKELPAVVHYGIETTVGDEITLHKLAEEATKEKKRINVHLYIDTGMSHFGCQPSEALSLARKIEETPFLSLHGVMTHFANADDEEDDVFTRGQINLFSQVLDEFKESGIEPAWIHPCNSAGAIRWHHTRWNMARVTLALYGLHNSLAVAKRIQTKQAISLTSEIVRLGNPKPGATVGYGRHYTIEREGAVIAVIPLGYHDGFHRSYSNRGEVLVHGMRVPMVGKICMDYMMLDVSHIPKVSIGDEVLIFGKNREGHFRCPHQFAEQIGTIPHELIASLGPRIRRHYTYSH